jgi:excisionase family DNA binding protein
MSCCRLLTGSPERLDAFNRPPPAARADSTFDSVCTEEPERREAVLLTIGEVAAQLRMSEKSVRRRIKDGTIRKVQLGERVVRIASDELIRLAAGDPLTAPGNDLDVPE